MVATVPENFVRTKDGKLKPVFGVPFNHSPLDDMKFSNSGMNLAEAIEILGGHIPPCNSDVLSIDWENR
jgi:hypothetical protein